MITAFSGEYRFLSNFYPCTVQYEGMSYPSVEHAYQAAKTGDMPDRRKIANESSPFKAKRLGSKVKLKANWDSIKDSVMMSLLKQKFSQSDLAEALINTGNEILIEGNTWNDKHWGCVYQNGDWVGKNHLGKMLMVIRNQLAEKKSS